MLLRRKKEEGEVNVMSATIKNVIDLHEISGSYAKGILHVIGLFGKSEAANLLSLVTDDGNVVEIRSGAGEITCRVAKREKKEDE